MTDTTPPTPAEIESAIATLSRLPGVGSVTAAATQAAQPLLTGFASSEGKLVAVAMGFLQALQLVVVALLATHAVTADQAGGATAALQALSAWLASQYSGDRAQIKAAAATVPTAAAAPPSSTPDPQVSA